MAPSYRRASSRRFPGSRAVSGRSGFESSSASPPAPGGWHHLPIIRREPSLGPGLWLCGVGWWWWEFWG